jgi:hypothetical protein
MAAHIGVASRTSDSLPSRCTRERPEPPEVQSGRGHSARTWCQSSMSLSDCAPAVWAM